MKKFKKILALALVMVLTATVTLGVTLAVLTDETAIKHNVFTAGNVSIDLSEVVGGDTAGGVTSDEEGGDYLLIAPGDELTKEVTVENTGAIPAYVAVTVTMNNALKINEAIDNFYENDPNYTYTEEDIQNVYSYIFENWGLNHYKTDAEGNALGMRLTITGDDMPEHVLQVDSVKTMPDYWQAYSGNWFPIEAEGTTGNPPFNGYYTSDMDPYEFKWTYYLYLEPGEASTLFTGINVPEYFVNEQMEMFDGLEIDIQGAAIQAENFATAQEAFTALRAAQQEIPPKHEIPAIINSQEALDAAIANGATTLNLAAGDYHMPNAAKGKTLTISGPADAVINVIPAGQGEAGGQLDYSLDGSNVTFNGVTIKTNSKTYAGYARLSATYNNCTIQNTYNLGVGNSVFNNCVFNITNEYLRVGGAYSAEFNGCTFNTDGRAILVYQDGTSVAQTVTVKDCVFNATAPANTWNGIHVAAVSIDGTSGTYVVNLEGTMAVDEDFNGLWQIKTGEANVVVNDNAN